MVKKDLKFIVFFLLLLVLIFFTFFVFAQGDRKLEVEYPEIAGFKPETVKTGLPEYVKYVFTFGVGLVGLVAFVSLVWAGVRYLLSAGQPAKLKEAKEQITSAFLGIILLLSSYILLTTINPELAVFQISPFLKPNLCETDKDCPRGFECKEKGGKKECVVKTSCQKNEDCPYTYKCESNTCVKQKEEITQIFWEIPIGAMIEDGLWEKERTNKLLALMSSFEEFLNKKIINTEGGEITKISDLNRYLKVLTESCHCEDTKAFCQKPFNFSFPAGTIGNPCKEAIDKISEVLKINSAKSNEILAYKEKFVNMTKIFEDEGRKFRNLTEEISEKCKDKGWLTRPEYYESVASIEEQGGKTELKRIYKAAGDDPFVFYCPVGGTIFDEPYAPQEISVEESRLAEETALPPIEAEPLSCPAVIPIGELVMDEISMKSYETNSDLEKIIFYIDEMLAGMTKMAEFTSKCFIPTNCDVSCACVPNPCYQQVCGCVPLCPAPPPIFTYPNFCYPWCNSPCLQALGGAHGEPCPRKELAETVELIKIYEEKILELLARIKESVESAQILLKNQEGDKMDLNTMRVIFQQCLSLGARTIRTEKPEEEPLWMLLPCEMALGNKGPDGNIIYNCHPNNFYCCTSKPPLVSPFPEIASRERLPVAALPPEEISSPSILASCKKNVPFFSQVDPRWKTKNIVEGYCPAARTLGGYGCQISAMAMAFKYLGVNTDPANLSDLIIKNKYWICGQGTPFGTGKKLAEKFGLKAECFSSGREIIQALEKNKNAVAVIGGKGTPPYSKSGHYILLTGIEQKFDQKFVCYNNPGTMQPKRMSGQEIISFFTNQAGKGCIFYK